MELTKPCRLWTGWVTNKGYGDTYGNGRKISAHRLAWERAYGPIPSGMFVCHHCDVKRCIEPTHLFLGTALDNNRDAVAKGRNAHMRGSLNGQAKLTAAQVEEIRATVRPSPPGVRGGGLTAAAQRYGVSLTEMSLIVSGKRWAE